jgi:hypothetical protein
MFKKGDVVICVDSSLSGKYLKKGELYVISLVDELEELSFVSLEGDFIHSWCSRRFRLLEEEEEESFLWD